MKSRQSQSQYLGTTRGMVGETLCDHLLHATRLSLGLNEAHADRQQLVLSFLLPEGVR